MFLLKIKDNYSEALLWDSGSRCFHLVHQYQGHQTLTICYKTQTAVGEIVPITTQVLKSVFGDDQKKKYPISEKQRFQSSYGGFLTNFTTDGMFSLGFPFPRHYGGCL